ncbi:MAG: replication-associated recombination protein A, partial [Campylobacterales bacterium]|nr:replication-associated recombination protein A [Campylobacterales bacterium]
IKQNNVPHSFFFGPPGCGKTTVARIIANELKLPFYEKNATTIKVEELRSIFNQYKNALEKPLVFIDEVHRLSKNQQEVLLPVMEENRAIIIGASTENPFFSLTGAIRSRGFLYEFKKINSSDLIKYLDKLEKELEIKISKKAKEYFSMASGGDVRAMLNHLEFTILLTRDISLEDAKKVKPTALTDGASESETHYNLASALIKSIRGSDENAAVYYLARLFVGGEDPRFIARRLLILASEDIGNANPNALNIANSTYQAVKEIGWPESRIILSQCVIYLANSPKSNSAYNAINMAVQAINGGDLMEIPPYLKDGHYSGAKELGVVGYKYPHDFGGWVEQKYLEKDLQFVENKETGFEKTLKEWKKKIKGE